MPNLGFLAGSFDSASLAQDDYEPMNFRLKIWRQRDAKSRGKLIDYEVARHFA